MDETEKVAPGREDVAYWSVDSNPHRFAEKVPAMRAPILLAIFALLSLGQLWAVNTISVLNAYFVHNDFIFAPATGGHAVPLRIFIISFLLAFGLSCDPRGRRKLAVSFGMVTTYVLFCLLLDAVLYLFYVATGTIFTLHFVEIVSGILGFAIFSFKLLEYGNMPARIPLKMDNTKTLKAALRLVIVAILAGFVSSSIGAMEIPVEEYMRSIGILGGIGPGIFLFFPLFFLFLYIWAIVEKRIALQGRFTPDLTVFVPAHNEEYIIRDTIRAMDAAAEVYDGAVKLLVMNNASTDDTRRVAQEALDDCVALKGEVIEVPIPGKANALNAGLDAVTTEFCVRVDADTQLLPQAFNLAMRHFVDPKMGVVGGLPVPPGGGLFDRARFLEVAVKHGFYSVAFETINSVVGIPGMFSVYRTELPRQLGGFVEGMNGEDTDISLRTGELGYRLLVDPAVRYISEVPTSYAHMREQRTRWFRSTFHISARCRDLIYAKQTTMRGKVVLPYMLINTARRTMMVPLALFGLLEYLTAFDSFNILLWQSLVAVFIGAPAIMAVICSFLVGRPRAVLYIPEYLIFRALRAYFTLESMLSISIKDRAVPIYSTTALAEERPLSPRIA